jgi:hypothetical protein
MNKIIAGQYTGIIKCLPQSWLDEKGGEEYLDRVFNKIVASGRGVFEISMPSKPKYDVLHFYLVIAGMVRYRLNIEEVQEGGTRVFHDQQPAKQWTAKSWMVLGAPVVRPLEPMTMKGFRGFRYTEGLF